jgi:hypothetical protein
MKQVDKKDGQDLLNVVRAKTAVDAIEAQLVALGHTVSRRDLFGEVKGMGITCVAGELVDLRVHADKGKPRLKLRFGFPTRMLYPEPKKGFDTAKIVADILKYVDNVKALAEAAGKAARTLMANQEVAARINEELASSGNRVKATERGLEVRTAPLTEAQARAVLTLLKETSK